METIDNKIIFSDDTDPWRYTGTKVLVNSPSMHSVMAEIVEPYDPDEENDDFAEYGKVFWCKRIDGQPWVGNAGDSLKYDSAWMAIHLAYFYKPPKGNWDSEEN